MSEGNSIHAAIPLIEVDSFTRNYYDLFITERFAISTAGPADTSDMAGLNQDLESGSLSVITYLIANEYDGFTHIIKDSGEFFYAVQIKSGDWADSFLKTSR
ncbi:hypothetical protein [Paenibacillus sp. Leaf72]|uniref:hypothetical protein n=1 Tax=Paenibacillus sp. Leaf72 TaxID=1736234 RepID=UPI0006F5D7DE|nr:hypothetical protein [Paenibacillus sp. Leaf72]KQN96924.1 hypothetical protein ASF12_22915 [Paenibacillus sp. Leaf72]